MVYSTSHNGVQYHTQWCTIPHKMVYSTPCLIPGCKVPYTRVYSTSHQGVQYLTPGNTVHSTLHQSVQYITPGCTQCLTQYLELSAARRLPGPDPRLHPLQLDPWTTKLQRGDLQICGYLTFLIVGVPHLRSWILRSS